jgi:hypothetical protein
MHELGHVFGFLDLNPEQAPNALMSATLETGVRRLPGATTTGSGSSPSDGIGTWDLTPDEDAADEVLAALINQSPWVVCFLEDEEESTGESEAVSDATSGESSGTSDSDTDSDAGTAGSSQGKGSKK